ncbi:helix-turn-helix domain-containing protein [Alkalicoccobacillus murimartini]|uniref:Transcriptional regulator with XRE-family HTH domain n=1 Tax=Alkalicoccobacillus murimartini TaxID=171685 RepID=A0ABT9YQD2_9BACI|nr:helix-turn-helix transcriptional regulator [Alkalicoccobacillus murimartini]MDQ0209234.1 transcriptional regulator with XRE-family HTH domain [Alkalicoccobacillus murimartini]
METLNWGRRIRAYRKLKGYTQESFAKAIGVSVSVLGEIERDTRCPDEQLVSHIASFLNISIEELRP